MPTLYPHGMTEEEYDAFLITIDPRQPCLDRPGSEERVDIYAARYRKGFPLYHPDDLDNEGNGRGQSPALKRAAIADFNPLTDAELCVDELEEPEDDESDWE